MEHLISQLQALLEEINTLMQRLDISGKAQKIEQLQQQANDPDFWSNPDSAQKVMQEIARLNEEVEHWRCIRSRITDALELAQLDDPDLLDELSTETAPPSGPRTPGASTHHPDEVTTAPGEGTRHAVGRQPTA